MQKHLWAEKAFQIVLCHKNSNGMLNSTTKETQEIKRMESLLNRPDNSFSKKPPDFWELGKLSYRMAKLNPGNIVSTSKDNTICVSNKYYLKSSKYLTFLVCTFLCGKFNKQARRALMDCSYKMFFSSIKQAIGENLGNRHKGISFNSSRSSTCVWIELGSHLV